MRREKNRKIPRTTLPSAFLLFLSLSYELIDRLSLHPANPQSSLTAVCQAVHYGFFLFYLCTAVEHCISGSTTPCISSQTPLRNTMRTFILKFPLPVHTRSHTHTHTPSKPIYHCLCPDRVSPQHGANISTLWGWKTKAHVCVCNT